ncbi:hypothetical protein [Inquilinus limosus]|uniref:Lipoprotein n=1 Tax=Inquilinus limosus TaxID=171674 RepID=A0A211ZQT5_9PROT|nr:hypothetical protein [Inquilinus limosus]OWJ67457.1 hypothetical protein BWR60_09635 [Inquilinus limosus]
MRAFLLVALLLAGCGTTVVEKPVMAPVDTPREPRLPKGVTVTCSIDWRPIELPATAEEMAAGRKADRELADRAIEECDSRRAKAVQHSRRRGAPR